METEGCKTEGSKYTGIGAAIFTTGILAGVSASFAFFTVFHSLKTAVAFGIFWGFMIFNLDRYIVVSIKKKKIDSHTTWKDRLKALAGE
ncbi:MAG TPA: DUF4407 domain-containing protein, partial [Pyrinomonadaceae bacterium]|nr:DUF4407 domain-containing protein [Pyrinomonadaceae bacterium]